ncbi:MULTISPECIES: YgjV family protein [unclassified Endozoicomonas]|uniref:YgjV family protein n=1 Tax=unclassified Endozoicomonas TaxID=2644528 RepID=UPI0021499523|nr:MULTISPECIES: YgjV family protein [unclassified Endozoicomonas]
MLEINFAQGVGLFAFIVGASAFLHQNGRRFRLHLTVFQILLCIHFIMMGAFTAAFGCGISAARSYASTRTKSNKVMWFFISLLWLMGLPSLQHSYELLTIFGASLVTWGLFQVDGIKLRLLVLFNSFCWLTNNLLLGSIGGTLMETTFIIVNLYTISKMFISRRAM